MEQLTVNDFFCGCGGMGIGFQNAGYEIKGAWDFDKYAVESYRENVGEHVKQADIKDMTWKEVPKSSVWAFGFPCQDLSVAGKQAGMVLECIKCGHQWKIDPDEHDSDNCPNCGGDKYKSASRSGLFFEIMRLLDETEDNEPEQMPKVLVAENVKGLKPFIGVLEAEFKKRGYTAHIELYNSKHWGVPQNRERYYIVGIKDGEEVTFQMPTEDKSPETIPKLSTVLEPDVDEKYYISDDKAKTIIEQALKRLEKLGKVHATITPDRLKKRQNGRRAKEDEDPMFTLTAQDLHGVIVQKPRGKNKGNIHEIAPTLTAHSYECNNHIIEEICQETGLLHPDGIGKTLRVGGGGSISKKHNYQHILVKEELEDEVKLKLIGMLDMKGNESVRRVYDPEGISPTLTASQGGHRQPKILEPIFVVPEATKKGYAVAEVAQTLLTGCEQVTLCPTTYRVRKLTPTEYGRLQAFPMDEWEQVVSDTQAYKQFGNAVTTNVAMAVAEAIKIILTPKELEKASQKFNPVEQLKNILSNKNIDGTNEDKADIIALEMAIELMTTARNINDRTTEAMGKIGG